MENQKTINEITDTLSSGMVKLQYVNDMKVGQARELRRKSTPEEKLLWMHLRNRKCNGYKFRRQQVIHGFIADFFCEELKLVIEVDGSIHDTEEQKKIDHIKDAVVKAKGMTMLRLGNDEVQNDIAGCLQKISAHISGTSSKNIGSV